MQPMHDHLLEKILPHPIQVESNASVAPAAVFLKAVMRILRNFLLSTSNSIYDLADKR
jgi:hypothetical protein